MILSRQTFEYQNQVLLEKVLIEAPFRYEAIFPNEGCFVYFNGAQSKVYAAEEQLSIKSNEAVLLKCGNYFVDWLKKTKENTVEVFAIHLYPNVLKKLYSHELPKFIKEQKSKSSIQRIIPENTLSKFIESLDFYFQNPTLVNDDLLELKIKELVLLLIQTNNASSIIQLIRQLFTPETVHLKEVVELHLYSAISVEELAKLCNLSLSSFKREFKKIFDSSPGNYINTKRLEKAKELLDISNLSVSDIAYETGFNDPSYFARLFKNKIGISPKTYREKSITEPKVPE